MLASQMAVTHALAMEVLGRAKRVKDIEQFDSAANAANKLLRTFAMQAEVLATIGRGGKQSMQIRHVYVHAGGQAVVGNVTSRLRAEGVRKVFIEPIRKPLPMHLSPRCGARTRKGNSCPQPATPKGRMHGGAKGSGGPTGKRNGRFRHGGRTQQAISESKMLWAWIKAARGFIEGL